MLVPIRKLVFVQQNVKFEACLTEVIQAGLRSDKKRSILVQMSIFVASVTLPDAGGEKIDVFLQTLSKHVPECYQRVIQDHPGP